MIGLGAPGLRALVVGSFMATAQAEVVPIDWDAQGRFEKSLAVAPGKSAEVCGRLTRGQSIAWAFEGDQPLLFNVHYHEGSQVRYPERRAVAAKVAASTLAVSLDQDYCWMWSNRTGETAALRLTLDRTTSSRAVGQP